MLFCIVQGTCFVKETHRRKMSGSVLTFPFRRMVTTTLTLLCSLLPACSKTGSIPKTDLDFNETSERLLRNSENRIAKLHVKDENVMQNKNSISGDILSDIRPLGFFWETKNPFLFCVHHLDHYPQGNDNFEPAASLLSGRDLGQDFMLKDGFRMYHGEKIPGFPAHPHRGFETVTVVLNGFVDHSDSHGEAGRYGNGDVQWMTAGSGLQHSEMFPLLNNDKPNTLDLFQIWINLPKAKKFCAPHFAMLWADKIPVCTVKDANERATNIRVIAGRINDVTAPDPAPDSWAADEANDVGIWLITMESGAVWNMPAASKNVLRTLYFYQGKDLRIGGASLAADHSAMVNAERDIPIENGRDIAHLLLLQGKPIEEPVVQHGPFVMNTGEEIRQAFSDYHKTQFGGWPWPRYDNVHPREKGRFAHFKDGREEFPTR